MHAKIAEQLEGVMTLGVTGSVARTVGMTISAAGFPAPVGALAEIERETAAPLMAEVIGFRDDMTLLYPLAEVAGVRRGNRVRLAKTTRWLRVGDALLGRVLNARGEAVDGKPQPLLADRVAFQQQPPHPCSRPRIEQPLATGVRAIDALLTCGRGQRMGIFSAAGVGKSTLLGMMARYTSAEIIVIGLIGERGREVNDFLERDLGPQGLARSVVVVATSNEPALERVQAAATATAIAEHFRDQGKDVLLLMDSLTRFALAQREIGLAAGEPPTTRGYPPSVFALLPKLVERAGRSSAGSITAFYTVLMEGDDPNEPISDAVRGLLDGHTFLSRKLAARGHFPAIDILASLSRLMPDLVADEHRQAAMGLREVLDTYRENEELISIGAYRRGGNRLVDLAIDAQDEIAALLKQPVGERVTFEEARSALLAWRQRFEKRKSEAAAPAMAAQGAPGAAAPLPTATRAAPSSSTVMRSPPRPAGR